MSPRFTFKRQPREIGNPYPSVEIKRAGKVVGEIAAASWRSKDSLWAVRFTVAKDGHPGFGWVTFKRRFESEDAARQYVTEHTVQIAALDLVSLDD